MQMQMISKHSSATCSAPDSPEDRPLYQKLERMVMNRKAQRQKIRKKTEN